MLSRRFALSVLVAAVACIARPDAIFAQGYSTEDIAAGKQLYRTNCTNCHGPNGDFVSGVDLGHGKFRRASTDNELVAIITQGIRDTPMPPANLSDAQAHQIVAYLRSMAAGSEATSGNKAEIAQGKAIFASQGCMNCHRVRGEGSRVGPDLTNVGARRTRADIEQSIVNPDAEVLAENRFVRLVTHNGETITGRILNEDTFSIQLITTKEKLMSVSKSDLSSYEFLKKSPMPSYRDKLSADELRDLVDYVASLKGL